MNIQTENNYPIDAVITWVDGNDKNYKTRMLPYVGNIQLMRTKKFRTRFNQVEEIKFTVDSILKYASFIRNIYIVTDNQTPLFLRSESRNQEKYSNVFIIDHKAIFIENEEFLPTFNCRTIETLLYKIPDLTEQFIYFNDDMFLLNETSPNDFFIDGLPVLRGKWLNFDEDILYKKIAKKILSKNKRISHKLAQQKAAKNIGFKRYFKFNHTPYPLRKSTFDFFFLHNNKIEIENVKYKFRNLSQFTPQGLANHIEIKNKTCVLKDDCQMVYIQSYKKPLWWYKYNLSLFKRNKIKLFLCMQSLDLCPQNKLNFILSWLNKELT